MILQLAQPRGGGVSVADQPTHGSRVIRARRHLDSCYDSSSDFPTRSATCRRNEPAWPAPPHIQLSYETNPVGSFGADARVEP